MRKKNCLLIITLCLIAYACDSGKQDGNESDTIKLSTRLLNFESTSSTQVVTTEGDGWWIGGVFANEVFLEDFPRGDVSKEDFEYQGEWFHVKKTDRRFEISVTENTTSKDRILKIGLQAGNYFDELTVFQQAR